MAEPIYQSTQGDGRRKHTVINAKDTGWFGWSLFTFALKDAMNITALA